jgi:hypothetical protein
VARDFPLRARYSIGAQMDLEKAHGVVLEDELIKFLGGEIKFEIDQWVLDTIYNAAVRGANGVSPATAIGAWDASLGTGREWLWTKYEFLDYIERGSNNIFQATMRAFGNVIIAGNDVARVIRQMGDQFKPAAGLGTKPPTGPHVIGTLNGRLVVQNPMYPAEHYVMGFRGDNYLFAGAVYAPYIPLFVTPTLVTGDMMAQKGFMSSSGLKIINAGMYTYGSISNIISKS